MDKPKKDNAIKVLSAALGRSSTSRTAIANDTGLSYVTVDKTVNFLLQEKILKQSLSSKSAVIERRSRMLSPRLHYFIAAYDILPNKFTFRIIDISLRTFKELSYTPEETPFIDDVLRDFLMLAVSFAERYVSTDCCIGSFVTVCGKYNEEDDKVYDSPIYHLPAIKIKKFFSDYSFNTVPRVYSLFSALAKALQETLAKDEAVYSLYLTKQSIYASYVLPDGLVTVKDIGNILSSRNLTLSRLIKAVPDPDILLSELCDILCVLTDTLHITKSAFGTTFIITSMLYVPL